MKKLKSDITGRRTLGTWLTIPHPSIAEILGKVGFDWLAIDLEHSAISLETAAEIIRVIDLQGITPLVRVGSHDPYIIKRVMDAGAHGIIASTVNDSHQAAEIVNAVRYPPKGTRGVGLSRAQGYGEGFEEYYEWLNSHGMVFVQIEHIEAVKNIDEIINTEGVDGYFIGPYDLSASLGIPGNFDHPDMAEALERVWEAGQKSGKLAGIHVVEPIHADLQKRIDQGYNFIAYGIDYLFMSRKAKEGVQSISQNQQHE